LLPEQTHLDLTQSLDSRIGAYGMSSKSTREKILEAAKELFAEKGFDKASIEQIAKRAGISKTLVFWYFKNKEGLIEEVAKEVAPSNIIQRCKESDLKGTAMLDCIIDSYYSFFEDEINKKLAIHLLDLSLTKPNFKEMYDKYCEEDLAEIAKKLFCKDEIARRDIAIMKMIHGTLMCNAIHSEDKQVVRDLLHSMLERFINC